jgi:hypothetical protein
VRKALAALAVASLLVALALRRSAPAATPPPTLVLLTTHARDPVSNLVLLEAGAPSLPTPVASFEHLPEGAVRGAIMPGTPSVLVVADRAPGRDLSYAGELLRIDPGPGHPAVTLCGGVVHSSSPLVTAAGRVFVARGAPGPALDDRLRVDELRIDEIDAASGAARPVWSGRGYLAFAAAATAGGELIVQHVYPGGASLLGIDPDRRTTRVIRSPMSPFARDFTLDGTTLVFAARDEDRSDRWTLERIDVASGTARRLYTSPHQALAPFAWPGGDVAYSDGETGLRLLGGGPRAPLGPGVDVVRAVGGGRAALWHFVADLPLPELAVVDVESGRGARVAVPPATHVEIVGFRR